MTNVMFKINQYVVQHIIDLIKIYSYQIINNECKTII